MSKSVSLKEERAIQVYTFHVGAVLGGHWAGWFTDAEILACPDDTGRIIAAVRDQAMLFGILLRIRDLAVPLLGVYPGRAACSESRDVDRSTLNPRESAHSL